MESKLMEKQSFLEWLNDSDAQLAWSLPALKVCTVLLIVDFVVLLIAAALHGGFD
jgi:hypothetical protein